MAKIPRIAIPVRKPTTQVPGRPIRQGSATGDVLQTLGQAAQEIFGKIQRARSLAELTKAQNERDLRLSDIQTRAANDTDLSAQNQKSYEDEIRKTNKESSKSITIPAERSLFELESENKANISRAKIQGSFRKKIIEQGAADLDIFIGNKENEFIQAGTPAGKQSAILERNEKIREAVQSGYISGAEATKRIDELDKEWGVAQVEYDIATNPLMARELLNAKAYPNVSELERVKLLNKVDTEMKRRSAELEDDINQKFLDEDITIEEIEAAGFKKTDGGIGSKTARTLIGQLERQQAAVIKDITADNEAAKSYVDLVDRMVTDRVDNFNAKQSLVEAMADGVITQEESDKFNKINKTLNNLKWNKEGGPLINAVKKIKSWAGASNATDEELAVSLRKLINDSDNASPEGVADEIIKQNNINTNPQWSNLEIGDTIDTPTGSVIVKGFFPDGEPDVEPVK